MARARGARVKRSRLGSAFGDAPSMEDEWDWRFDPLSSADWDAIYSDADDIPQCTICGDEIDDRRYCVALFLHRAWSPGGVEYRFAHVECLRNVTHHTQRLW